MMTIEEIRTGKEGQTFDLKSIHPSLRWLMLMAACWQSVYLTRPEELRALINIQRN